MRNVAVKVGRWSKIEDDYILENYKTSADCKVIGSHLNRSAVSVLMRFKKLTGLVEKNDCNEQSENGKEENTDKVAGKDSLMNLTKVVKLSFPASSLSTEVGILSRALLALCSNTDVGDYVDVSVMVRVR